MDKIEKIIKENIIKRGAIPVSEFIEIAMNEPEYGYYVSQKPIGSAGDFITAPEISQIFGEIIGVWAFDYFQRLNLSCDFQVIDLGGGRGTLLQDISRINKNKNTKYGFLEINKHLIKEQKSKISQSSHYKDISEIPNLPTLFIGNEFLDVFPIKQFKKEGKNWKEVFIKLENNKLRFCLRDIENKEVFNDAIKIIPPEANFFELNLLLDYFISNIGEFLKKNNGIAIFIDYGYVSGYGNTLQSIKNHKSVDPLSLPGEVDLTAHVNFSQVIYSANKNDMDYFGPTSQRSFFIKMGALKRLEKLLEKSKTKKNKDNLELGIKRIIEKNQMGELFKVIAIAPKNKLIPEGFD
ncbi:MAG: SAM-dependent methyltransferase [Pseudomonadota bacterium]|nr:SAM-dependent methyltransferase [Pseudomonadota bacterium]MEC7830770.1 SAM-dependent methyltransferase [Pseudomonadota bacterium]MEC9382662.1 SAM-dependent methyltransferase [Pseudomonadota bacterium]